MSEAIKDKTSAGKAMDLRLMFRIYKLASPYRGYLIFSFLLTVGYAYTGPLIPAMVAKALNSEVMSGDLSGLNTMVAMILGVYLLNTLMLFARTWFSSLLAQNVVYDLRNRVYTYITRLKLKYIDKTPVWAP